jgi:hypothetical protein
VRCAVCVVCRYRRIYLFYCAIDTVVGDVWILHDTPLLTAHIDVGTVGVGLY